MTNEINFFESTGNLFKDVGFEDHEAKRLQFKSYLMVCLIKYIKLSGLSQVEAAERLGMTASRMSNLMNHKIDLFSTEMLLQMMERAGFRIYEKIQLDINAFMATAGKARTVKS